MTATWKTTPCSSAGSLSVAKDLADSLDKPLRNFTSWLACLTLLKQVSSALAFRQSWRLPTSANQCLPCQPGRCKLTATTSQVCRSRCGSATTVTRSASTVWPIRTMPTCASATLDTSGQSVPRSAQGARRTRATVTANAPRTGSASAIMHGKVISAARRAPEAGLDRNARMQKAPRSRATPKQARSKRPPWRLLVAWSQRSAQTRTTMLPLVQRLS